MSPASRRKVTAGKASPLSENDGNGISSPGPVRGAASAGRVSEQLHLVPREGFRGRRGEAAIMTPVLVLLVSFRERLLDCDAVVEVGEAFFDKESEMLHFCGVIVEEGTLAG